eukprot:6173724-Pleurochrysis_carterae.AAC.2
MDFPKWLNNSIEEDANHFMWKSKPIFHKDNIGTKGRVTGKYINKAATNVPLTKGGAGCLNWKAHTKAFLSLPSLLGSITTSSTQITVEESILPLDQPNT